MYHIYLDGVSIILKKLLTKTKWSSVFIHVKLRKKKHLRRISSYSLLTNIVLFRDNSEHIYTHTHTIIIKIVDKMFNKIPPNSKNAKIMTKTWIKITSVSFMKWLVFCSNLMRSVNYPVGRRWKTLHNNNSICLSALFFC